MKQNNSIINSLKRLERVGSETSIVTKKLKQACENTADRLDNIIRPYLSNIVDPYTNSQKITAGLLYVCGDFCFDYDGCIFEGNWSNYRLAPHNKYITRDCALAFSKAIAEGLLEKVSNWIEKRKVEAEKALQSIENNQEDNLNG